MEFALKVIASFLVGGAYVAMATRAAERFGPKVGGVLAGLPSTALVGLVFIYLTQNSLSAVHSVKAIPAGFGFTLVLITIYALLRTRGKDLKYALSVGIAVWLALAIILVTVLPKNLLLSTVIFIAAFIASLKPLDKITSLKPKGFSLKTGELLARASLAGMVVALAVLIAKISGPYLGGVVASFPISVLSSIIILDLRRGGQFAAATVKSIPYGLLGNTVFVIAFYVLVPRLNMLLGTIFAYLIGLVAGIAILQIRNMRHLIRQRDKPQNVLNP